MHLPLLQFFHVVLLEALLVSSMQILDVLGSNGSLFIMVAGSCCCAS